MESNKINTQLNAAINATPEELNNSPELRTGYLPNQRSWELIVRYTGDINGIQTMLPNAQITELLNNYAIIQIPENEIETLASLNQIIFIEKPKRLFYEVTNGKRVSCVPPVQVPSGLSLTGLGTLIAIIDSGIDYSHPDFISENGNTRILLLWDQSLDQIYDSDTINAALRASTTSNRYTICPSVDLSGHGTHVAGIAAGNGRASSGTYRGVAYEASLLVVKLARPATDSFPSTIELLKAVDFCIRQAILLNLPLSINLSFGNTYGAHNGSSLLESYLDAVGNLYKCSIICGSGNEGAAAGHSSGQFTSNKQTSTVELSITEFTPSLSVQLWKNPWDIFEITITNPQFNSIVVPATPGNWRFTLDGTDLYITVGSALPYNIYQEIYIDFSASSTSSDSYIDFGIWQLSLTAVDIKSGIWDMWLPSIAVRSLSTGFLISNPDTTLTIPSSAEKIITVGAYDSHNYTLADFSGRGFSWNTNQIKPELVAPGVDIISCAPGGGYETRSGTSMATPFVTGSCALLMQWGIVNGNDIYMYGEKIKAALISGTRKLPFENSYPSKTVGWGALCLYDSLLKSD